MDVRKDKLRFFRTPAGFRRWLETKHVREQELWVGFYNKDSGKGGITYPQALDEALCYGWIDGIRKNLDESSFTIRFTPRKKRSIWSNVNIAHVKRLTDAKRMAATGIAAFDARDPERTGVYSFERKKADLLPPMRKRLDADKAAASYFDTQPPSYRRAAVWWVISAKREETRVRRLDQLIGYSANGLWIPHFLPIPKRRK